MVSRKGFFGLMLMALSTAGVGLAARASPIHPRRVSKGEVLETVPTPQRSLIGAEERQLCKMVICASPGMSPDPADHNLHWHGPLSGYVKIGHEFADHYEKSGVLAKFGLVEIPAIDASNRCFVLGTFARIAVQDIGHSPFKSYKGQTLYQINAQAILDARHFWFYPVVC